MASFEIEIPVDICTRLSIFDSPKGPSNTFETRKIPASISTGGTLQYVGHRLLAAQHLVLEMHVASFENMN